jgi:hypothetical protein
VGEKDLKVKGDYKNLEGEGERGGVGIKSNEEVNMIKHIHV